MPIYMFKCGACGAARECLRPLDLFNAQADPYYPPKCDCGAVMTRQPTAPAIQFKGAGWAKDGYSK